MSDSRTDEVERVRGLAILLANALLVDTNANTATIKVENATYKDKLLGDIELTVKLKRSK